MYVHIYIVFFLMSLFRKNMSLFRRFTGCKNQKETKTRVLQCQNVSLLRNKNLQNSDLLVVQEKLEKRKREGDSKPKGVGFQVEESHEEWSGDGGEEKLVGQTQLGVLQ